MGQGQEQEEAPLRIRTIGSLVPQVGDTVVTVDHVYAPEGEALGKCHGPGCNHNARDRGFVGLPSWTTRRERGREFN